MDGMFLTIRALPTKKVAPILRPLVDRLGEEVSALVRGHEFDSTITGVSVTIMLTDPDTLVSKDTGPPNSAQRRRSDNRVYSAFNVDFAAFVSADEERRYALVWAAFLSAIRQISQKYLSKRDREFLLEIGSGSGTVGVREDTKSSPDNTLPEDDTMQIVVQWLSDEDGTYVDPGAIEDVIEARMSDVVEVDGNDFGAGTVNIFLYAHDSDSAVDALIALYREGLLPVGMRIGIEVDGPSSGGSGYRAAFPPELQEFEIM